MNASLHQSHIDEQQAQGHREKLQDGVRTEERMGDKRSVELH